MAKQESQQKRSSIDLNSADVDQLDQIEGLGRNRAQKLVDFRNQHGPFKTWDDVKKIPGYSEQIVSLIKQSGATCK